MGVPHTCDQPMRCSSCGQTQSMGASVLYSHEEEWVACEECTRLAFDQPVEAAPGSQPAEAASGSQPVEAAPGRQEVDDASPPLGVPESITPATASDNNAAAAL